ncbi:MAG: hypothetical protein MI924_00450 [Chloroflexales bacterium]|nr:hypothetical protein [Chloroflexales bacterium]
MPITKILIRLARAVLDNVLSQLMQQFNVVEEQALSPMRNMIQQVTDGIWIGEGANAFVEEVSNLMIPGVGKVGEQISTINTNLQFARDTIDRADEEVDRLVKGRIFDSFGFY